MQKSLFVSVTPSPVSFAHGAYREESREPNLSFCLPALSLLPARQQNYKEEKGGGSLKVSFISVSQTN